MRTDHLTTPVIVRRRGQFLGVEPPPPELRLALVMAALAPAPHPQRGIEIRCVPSRLYREVGTPEKPELESFMGLLPVIRSTLASSGYQVEERFASSPSLPEPDIRPITQQGLMDVALLDLVRHQERGLIRYRAGGVDPVWILGQVALAWPGRTLAVAVTRVEEARAVRDQLGRFLPGVVAVTSRNHPADEQVGRVVIATYTGLGHNGVEIEKRELVIALDAIEASRTNPLSLLGHARRARLYGLLPSREATAPLDRDAVRLLFGFHEIVLSRHGVSTVQVEVVRCPHGGGSPLPNDLGALEVKRQGLWGNRARNRRLAGLARLLHEGDLGGLQNRFPSVLPGPRECTLPRVLLLVENVEHGLALRRLLPGWPLVTSSAVSASKVGKDRGMIAQEPPGEVRGSIATMQGIVEFGGIRADVVIRADGGSGLPLDGPEGQSPEIVFNENNWSSSNWASPGRRLLLIDLDDRHHPLLRRWSRRRWQCYAEHGWYAPGMDPVEARVARFLATRPEGES